MVPEGLVVFSDVDIIKYAYRALETAGPSTPLRSAQDDSFLEDRRREP